MTDAERRQDRAARSRIRSLLTQTIGDRDAYRCNLYHRHDGWHYQLHSSNHMEHLGRTVAQVAGHLRQLALARQATDHLDDAFDYRNDWP